MPHSVPAKPCRSTFQVHPEGGPRLHLPPPRCCPQIHSCAPHQPLSWVTDALLMLLFLSSPPPARGACCPLRRRRSLLTQAVRSSGYSTAPMSPSKWPHWGSQASHSLGPPPPCPHPLTHSAPATPASLLFFKPTSYIPAPGSLHSWPHCPERSFPR